MKKEKGFWEIEKCVVVVVVVVVVEVDDDEVGDVVENVNVVLAGGFVFVLGVDVDAEVVDDGLKVVVRVMVVVDGVVIEVVVGAEVVAVVDEDGLVVVGSVVMVVVGIVVVVVIGVVVVEGNNGQHPSIPSQTTVVLTLLAVNEPASENRSSPSANWLMFAKIEAASMVVKLRVV